MVQLGPERFSKGLAIVPVIESKSKERIRWLKRMHFLIQTEGFKFPITTYCMFNIKHYIKHTEDYHRRQCWAPGVETLDFTIRICSTSTFLYFDLYLNTAYAANVYLQLCLFYDYNVNRKIIKHYSINYALSIFLELNFYS